MHRTWRDVREIVEAASLPAWPEARALDAFRRLAAAEGLIHRLPPDEVQFHEVGSLDAIGDVIGVCVAAASLGADEITCSPLPTSRGFVRAAHGRLPLPAPATLEILREAGAPLVPLEVGVELVTPTGAALVAALATTFGAVPRDGAAADRLRRRNEGSGRCAEPRPRRASATRRSPRSSRRRRST